ncbi:MAG: hypothetical protein D6820_12565 [Lentisphaerae bacterium]|nr:MAG: hypothetical protein D6820_12565 [Lentisphaerota bacterium]
MVCTRYEALQPGNRRVRVDFKPPSHLVCGHRYQFEVSLEGRVGNRILSYDRLRKEVFLEGDPLR